MKDWRARGAFPIAIRARADRRRRRIITEASYRATLGKGASGRRGKRYEPGWNSEEDQEIWAGVESVGRKDSPRRRTYDDLHAKRRRRRWADHDGGRARRPPRNDRRRPRKKAAGTLRLFIQTKIRAHTRSPSPSSRYAPWDNSSGWDTILRRPCPLHHISPNPEGWCPSDKAFVHVTPQSRC